MPYMFIVTAFNNENDWDYRRIYVSETEEKARLVHETITPTSTQHKFDLSDVTYIDGKNPVEILTRIKSKAAAAGYDAWSINAVYIKNGGNEAYALRIGNRR